MLLGAAFAIPQLWALLKPAHFAASARKFPRSEIMGYILMAIGASWFLFKINQEAIAEFAAYKTYMLLGFGSVAFAACFFVPDFLAVRGLAVTTLMLASYTLGFTRWADSQWRLVLVIWAYVSIILSMWFMISPWRLRDFLNWMTANPGRLRSLAIGRLAFAILVIILGATVYK